MTLSLPTLGSEAGYGGSPAHVKERIRTAQVRAALSVNRELVLLYLEY